jgi:hypothetical protein
MKKVDLENLSPEKRAKILAILNEPIEENQGEQIKKEYLAGVKSIKKSEEYEGIALDTKSSLESDLKSLSKSNAAELAYRRRTGQLRSEEKETYRQLEIMHEDGIWDRIKEVVESRKVIKKEDADSDISYLNEELNR